MHQALQAVVFTALLYTTVFLWPMYHDFVHESGHALAFTRGCPGSSALVSLGAYELWTKNVTAGEIGYRVFPSYFFHSLYRTSLTHFILPDLVDPQRLYDEYGNDTAAYPPAIAKLNQECSGNEQTAWYFFSGPLQGLTMCYLLFTMIVFGSMVFGTSWYCWNRHEILEEIQMDLVKTHDSSHISLNKQGTHGAPLLLSPHGQLGEIPTLKDRVSSAFTRAPLVLFMPERYCLRHLDDSVPRFTRVFAAFCIRFIQADVINEIFYGFIPSRTVIFTWASWNDGPVIWQYLVNASVEAMYIVGIVFWVPLVMLYIYGFWLFGTYVCRVYQWSAPPRYRTLIKFRNLT